jgi:DNA repair protein RadD
MSLLYSDFSPGCKPDVLDDPPIPEGEPGLRLHPFQQDAVAAIERDLGRGGKVLLVAPTGSGKTVIASEVIRHKVAQYGAVLFLAHRREIIQQTSDKLTANGVRHGIIMAGVDPRPMEAVQVASIDTLHVRGVRSDAMPLPPADLVVFDEAHRARGRTREHLLSLYPNAALLGMTATPCRADGRGLGNIFTIIVQCPQVAELIEGGYLVKSRLYAPVDPDLRGVRTQQGDYVVGQLEHRMNTDALVGDIVTHWLKYGERRRTVVFAVGVEHSIHIRNEFAQAGVRAEHLDGNTPIAEREAILERLRTGETEIVTNCMVLTEGWDMPEVGCCILARPTKQMGLYRQMIGRVLRPAVGKTDAVILDHSGAWRLHGRPEDPVEWTLDVDKRARNVAHEQRERGEAPALLECPSCHAIMVSPPCDACGWKPQPRARAAEFEDGDLALVVGGKAKTVTYDATTRRQWHGMFVTIAQERGYQRGWIAHKFKEKFGTWPDWGSTPEPLAPTPEVRSWVRSRQIAYAKRREAAA